MVCLAFNFQCYLSLCQYQFCITCVYFLEASWNDRCANFSNVYIYQLSVENWLKGSNLQNFEAECFYGFFLSFSWIFQSYHRRYMAEILPIRRKTLSNQSIHSIISWYDNFIIARPSMFGTRGHWAASVLYLATPIVTRSSLRTRDIHTCCGALDSACFMTKVCRNWDLNTRPSACKANALVN